MGVHIMVDLETWGDTNDAAIVSIGAVKFNATEILDRFHVGVTPESNELFKRDITARTMLWWMDEARADARKAWFELEKTDLASALEGFRLWVLTDEIAGMWGNGATFDNVILRSAYQAVGNDYPVPFWLDKCYRTTKGHAPNVKLKRVGTHHSAVDDAESQALHLQHLALQLGVEL